MFRRHKVRPLEVVLASMSKEPGGFRFKAAIIALNPNERDTLTN